MDEGWKHCEEGWQRLRWARLQRFETAKAAAESMHIKESTYTAYERRPDSSKHTKLTHQAAATFAKKFRVNWLWLLTGQGTPETEEITQPQARILAATAAASLEEQERVANAVEALLGRTGTTG